MQTSLRSNYLHYYDYGTRDCVTTHTDLQPIQDQHDHHLLQNSFNSNQDHHHSHHDVVQTSSSAPGQQQHHPMLQEAIPQDLLIDPQRPVEPIQDASCYVDPQDITGSDARAIPSDQLVVYNQPHNQYQILATNDQLASAHEAEIVAANLDQSEGLENLYQHHHHQQQVQTTAYQTVYYETVDYSDNCAIEPVRTGDNGGTQDQQVFSDHHIVQTAHFSEQQQQHHNHQPELHQQHQAQPSSANEANYFQYIQPPTENLVHNHSSHHSDSPLPAVIEQQHQPYIETHQALDGLHNYHVYRTLELGDHSFAPPTQINQSDQFGLLAHQPDENLQQSCAPQYDECKQDQFVHDNDQVHYGSNYYLDSGSTGVSISHSRDSHSSAASIASSEDSTASSLTRDEKRAREANIPMTYYEIVNLTIEQFNEQLAKHNLSESQLTLIKDIRRRGKNKVAAQSCRKRKMEQIHELQHEVDHLVSKRRSLSFECSQLMKDHGNLVQEYDKVYAIIQERMQYEPLK